MERPTLLTVAQAAEYLCLPRTTVYDLVQHKKLPHLRMGVRKKAIRISERDLAAYLRNARVEPETDPKIVQEIRRRMARPFPGLVHLRPPAGVN